MKLPQIYIDDIIKNALKEDINYIDMATDLLIPESSEITAKFVAKTEGVLCGIDIALRVFSLIDSSVFPRKFVDDGEKVKKGQVLAEISGKTVSLLKGERTSLNLLQHMSGIATYTNKCVSLVEGTNAAIADTRKTLPGIRALQKYAVVVGGGRNHRFNLSDAAMLKDNHIDAYGSITGAVNELRKKAGHMVQIEVEARTIADVKEALECGVNVIMLDNMNYEQMTEAVNYVNKRAKLEASGNITLANINEVAKTGVDIISLGALTHSVKAFDISMILK